jgi:hypothetical protein
VGLHLWHFVFLSKSVERQARQPNTSQPAAAAPKDCFMESLIAVLPAQSQEKRVFFTAKSAAKPLYAQGRGRADLAIILKYG